MRQGRGWQRLAGTFLAAWTAACGADATEVPPAAEDNDGSSSDADAMTTNGSSSTNDGDDAPETTGSTGPADDDDSGDDSSDGSTSGGEGAACGVGQWSGQTPEPGPSLSIDVGDQVAWQHDEGHPYGVFNTFDDLVACDSVAPRKVHVFLPRDYDVEDRHYPVVYMNDGNTAFWPDGFANKTWDVATRLGELDSCEVEPVIVVAVHPLDRNLEYTHTEWGGPTCCGVEAYADYLADCLKPFIDANYRTRSDPESTAIAGSSHGGLASFVVSALRHDQFGNVIAMSSSFWAGLDYGFGGGALNASYLIELVTPGLADPFTRPRVWLDWGLVREGGDHNAVIEALATERGEEMVQALGDNFDYVEGDDLFTFVDEDGGHDEDAWSTRIGPAVQALFPVR